MVKSLTQWNTGVGMTKIADFWAEKLAVEALRIQSPPPPPHTPTHTGAKPYAQGLCWGMDTSMPKLKTRAPKYLLPHQGCTLQTCFFWSS